MFGHSRSLHTVSESKCGVDRSVGASGSRQERCHRPGHIVHPEFSASHSPEWGFVATWRQGVLLPPGERFQSTTEGGQVSKMPSISLSVTLGLHTLKKEPLSFDEKHTGTDSFDNAGDHEQPQMSTNHPAGSILKDPNVSMSYRWHQCTLDSVAVMQQAAHWPSGHPVPTTSTAGSDAKHNHNDAA